MAFGLSETILPLGLLALFIVLFGRSAIVKIYKDFTGIKADIKKIDEEAKVEIKVPA